MSPRELLQAMNPRGVFDSWSNEDVMSQIIWQLRHSKAAAIQFGKN